MGGSSEVVQRVNKNPFSAMARTIPTNEYASRINHNQVAVLPGDASRSKGHTTKNSPRNIKIKISKG